MIQRKQTLYWFIDLILLGLTFFTVSTPEQFQWIQVAPSLFFDTLLGVGLVFDVVLIFLFKRRIVQLKLNHFHLGLKLLWAVYVLLEIFYGQMRMDLHYPLLVLPILGFGLSYAAQRGIQKDEALIRSVDRIR
ncbi:MAG: DUF4293 family protein [Bacteroidetes bacterium]|nr:DUF4293 family protein [Bacteroidota bacterium]MDA0938359.1 DUF4293 family protein [Bacteroidota bacterium]MDA1344918.1 DUF4293 family protein [Bacteroidota bacterium]